MDREEIIKLIIKECYIKQLSDTNNKHNNGKEKTKKHIKK